MTKKAFAILSIIIAICMLLPLLSCASIKDHANKKRELQVIKNKWNEVVIEQTKPVVGIWSNYGAFSSLTGKLSKDESISSFLDICKKFDINSLSYEKPAEIDEFWFSMCSSFHLYLDENDLNEKQVSSINIYIGKGDIVVLENIDQDVKYFAYSKTKSLCIDDFEKFLYVRE